MSPYRKKNFAASLFQHFINPIQVFMHQATAGGVVLLCAALTAMVLANSPLSDLYFSILNTSAEIKIGTYAIQKSLQHWINDGLMVIFFFLIGLEIKRELLHGELSAPKKAALPIFAAIGGMLVPGAIYMLFNFGQPGANGWAIPMATDIAFAVGALILLGKRIPLALKVLLLGLAIADDLGAIIIIAAFYTGEVSSNALGYAGLGLLFIFLFRFVGVRRRLVYFILSLGVWFFVMKSGVHSTIAGVVLGFLTPITPLVSRETLIKALNHHTKEGLNTQSIEELRICLEEALSPLERGVRALHNWVAFVVLPLFALANAGVPLTSFKVTELFQQPVSLGIILGLFIGKPLGISLFAYLACKMKLAELPRGVSWSQILGLGFLAGIGFTMALFVSLLSLSGPEFGTLSKMGILVGSLMSFAVGMMILLLVPKSRE